MGWESAESANEASPVLFFLQKKCVLRNAEGSAAVVRGLTSFPGSIYASSPMEKESSMV
jgi:hypothetical protein